MGKRKRGHATRQEESNKICKYHSALLLLLMSYNLASWLCGARACVCAKESESGQRVEMKAISYSVLLEAFV